MKAQITKYDEHVIELANSDQRLMIVKDDRYDNVEVSLTYEADTDVMYETTCTFDAVSFYNLINILYESKAFYAE